MAWKKGPTDLHQVFLLNMPENILNEYTSPDITYFKEKRKRSMNYTEEHWALAEKILFKSY